MDQSKNFAYSDQVMKRLLLAATLVIDEQFGQNYSIKNPALVAALAKIGFDALRSQHQTLEVCQHGFMTCNQCGS